MGDLFSCQVLAPSNRKVINDMPGATKSNIVNCDYINKKIQASKKQDGEPLRYGGVNYFPGDKVLFSSIKSEDNYFINDVGIIKAISEESVTVVIDGMDFELCDRLLDDLSLAYAMPINNLYCDAYATIIIALPSEPKYLLHRKLLYSAIARARRKVVLITAPEVVDIAAKRIYDSRRNSKLPERIRGFR